MIETSFFFLAIQTSMIPYRTTIRYLTGDEKKRQKTVAFTIAFETLATLATISIFWLTVGDPSSECEIPESFANQTVNMFEHIAVESNKSFENLTLSETGVVGFNLSQRYILSAAMHLVIFLIVFALFTIFIKEKKVNAGSQLCSWRGHPLHFFFPYLGTHWFGRRSCWNFRLF